MQNLDFAQNPMQNLDSAQNPTHAMRACADDSECLVGSYLRDELVELGVLVRPWDGEERRHGPHRRPAQHQSHTRKKEKMRQSLCF